MPNVLSRIRVTMHSAEDQGLKHFLPKIILVSVYCIKKLHGTAINFLSIHFYTRTDLRKTKEGNE